MPDERLDLRPNIPLDDLVERMRALLEVMAWTFDHARRALTAAQGTPREEVGPT
jgi:hypothetical protein